MCHPAIIMRWIRYRSDLESCSIASELDMSPGHILGYTRMWWLSQNLRLEEPKNMTQCYFVVYIAPARHQCRRWRLCCEVNSTLLNGRHEFRTQATNRRDLANMNIPRISWTCYRMEEMAARGIASTCSWIRGSTSADVILIAPASLKLFQIPRSIHICLSLCTVYVVRFVLDGPTWSSQSSNHDLHKVVCLLELHPLVWPGILHY